MRPATVLDALASPARHEILSVLGEGPATVRDLAARLGRSRQALHYHVNLLERAGLIRGDRWRGTGPGRERVYQPAVDRFRAGARPSEPGELAQAGRIIRTMLRAAGREVDAAVAANSFDPRLHLGLRAKAHLGRAAARRLARLIGEMEELLRGAKRPGRGRTLVAVTLVVAPAERRGGQ